MSPLIKQNNCPINGIKIVFSDFHKCFAPKLLVYLYPYRSIPTSNTETTRKSKSMEKLDWIHSLRIIDRLSSIDLFIRYLFERSKNTQNSFIARKQVKIKTTFRWTFNKVSWSFTQFFSIFIFTKKCNPLWGWQTSSLLSANVP